MFDLVLNAPLLWLKRIPDFYKHKRMYKSKFQSNDVHAEDIETRVYVD